jgi:hypothetical protein
LLGSSRIEADAALVWKPAPLASLSWFDAAPMKRGVPTPGGAGRWQAVQVQRVLDRADGAYCSGV